MSEVFDIVVIGAGHNGLTTAGYLAKAGKSVLVLEAKEFFGGGVSTRELTLPGFKHDAHSSCHMGILMNPLIANDELGLLGKYGLEYLYPDATYSTTFTDGSCLIGYNDLDRTIDSIAQISKKDADAYYKLYQESSEFVPLAMQGMFAPPPPYGAFIAMLDQSPMGRNVLNELHNSPLGIVNERFESDKVKVHMMRLLMEHFIDPEAKGEGGVLYMYPAFIQKYGFATPRGGSGALVDAMVRQLEDNGAELRTNSNVVKVLTSNGKAIGVRLEDGSEIRAKEAVVGQIHPFNLPDMVEDGLEDQTRYEIKRAETASFSCVTAQYALDKPPTYVHEDIHSSWLNGLCPTSMADLKKVLFDVRNGYIPSIPSIGTIATHKVDPSRAPEGKSTFLAWRVMPFKLADGSSWEDRRAEVEEETLDLIDSFMPGLKASVIGKAFDTPEDIANYSPTFQNGDVSGLASPLWQSQGNRPTPSLSQYTVPGVENLYLSGVFMHPTAGGVCGGGRATAVKLFDDKGWDFDKVTG